MAIKADRPPANPPPPGSTSSGGETESLLGASNQPPSYTPNPSLPASGLNSVYPSLPPSASRADQPTHSGMSTPQGAAQGYSPLPQSPAANPLPMPVWAQASAREAADRRARWRIVSAVFWGFVIWGVVGLVTGGAVVEGTKGVVGKKKAKWEWSGGPPAQHVAHSQTCARFGPGAKTGDRSLLGPIYSTSTSLSFELANTDTAIFYGAGSWSHGHLDIVRDSSIKTAVVDLSARYDDRDLLDAAAVCTVKDGVTKGVFIQTPEGGCHGICPQLRWDVKYRIPTKLSALDGLAVNASIFSVSAEELFRIEDLAVSTSNAGIELLKIDSARVNLKTTNAQIIADGQAAEKAIITSSNGKISGSLAGPDITAKTSNSPITGSFVVHNKLSLHTSNGKVDVAVSLVNPAGATDPGMFDVGVSSTNDKVTVQYDQQPFGSTLTSQVGSTNGHVLVKHHYNYEGAFALATTNGPATVVAHSTEHPDFPELRREVSVGGDDKRGRTRTGEVHWVGKEREVVKGTSAVKSTNGHVDVEFA